MNKKRELLFKKILLTICFFVSTGCEDESASDKKNKTIIAHINDSTLYQSDVETLTTGITDSTDKIQIVNNYVRKWTIQQLMVVEAEKKKNI